MLGEQRAGSTGSWRSRVDPDAGAVMGISMGGTLAWWLAAMDPRFAAAVSMCCFADLGRLVETGRTTGTAST
jgi:pimeloyl-ACP methyl ester carboxylesterase